MNSETHGGTVADDLTGRLREELRGTVHLDGDADFEDSRSLWNAMPTARPSVIVHPSGAADVQKAIELARDADLEVSVRGGGHNSAGLALTDGGMMIHLTKMRGVTVDPTTRRARVQGGANWGDYDRETHAWGLASTGGAISTTGVAGLSLGGGLGLLMRKYGLTIDQLRGAEVVTADSRVVRADAEENPDLFWALRGGGGNFGVVTSFEFALQDITHLYAGFIHHPMATAAQLIRDARDIAEEAPDEMMTIPVLTSSPDGEPVLMFEAVYVGDAAAGERRLAPLTGLGRPIHAEVDLKPYPRMQCTLDPLFPTGLNVYWRSHLLRELTDEAIDVLVEWGSKPSSPLNVVLLEQMGGAVARVPAEETVFEHREAKWNVAILGRWSAEDDGARDAHVQWVRSLHEALLPFAFGTYVNYLGIGESADQVKTAYPENKWKRLSAIKREWDPDNVFHRNQNITPA